MSLAIGLIGNCQVGPLMSAFSLYHPHIVWRKINVNTLRSRDIQYRIEEEIGGLDLIFSQPLGDNFGQLSTKSIRDLYPNKLVVFPNIFFRGFHPDMIYLGGQGKRFQSPVGDYHCIPVIQAFCEGVTCEDLKNNFNEYFEKFIDVDRVYKSSKDELINRSREVDFPIENLLDKFNSDEVFMLTFNHPNNSVVAHLASIISEIAQLRIDNSFHWVKENLFNALTKDVAWPIHKPVFSNLRLKFNSPWTFRSADGKLMLLNDFIGQSYRLYESWTFEQRNEYWKKAADWGLRE